MITGGAGGLGSASAAFSALLDALPWPFGEISTTEAITPHLVGALERRSTRMIYPRVGWVLLILRSALTTSVLTRRSRAAAPEIRRRRAADAQNGP